MIQANELRIGNCFLNPNTGKVIRCTCEDISDIQNGYKTRLPIPLTPEILEKCGFKHTWGDIYELEDGFGVYASLRNGWMVSQSRDISNIKGADYLHQLQNLYFALTGEELKIKL